MWSIAKTETIVFYSPRPGSRKFFKYGLCGRKVTDVLPLKKLTIAHFSHESGMGIRYSIFHFHESLHYVTRKMQSSRSEPVHVLHLQVIPKLVLILSQKE
jgi:hypothetical protein